MKAPQIQDSQDMEQYLSQVRELDIDSIADMLGLKKCSRGFKFDFFSRPILFYNTDFIDLSGVEIQPKIKSIFCQYLLKSRKNAIKSSGRLVTFREFSGAGPLFSRFAENTSKTLGQTFANRLAALEKKCKRLLGMPADGATHDLSVRFTALPKIPVILQFNDADDILPASAALLFHEDAEQYLDLKSLAAIGTYLTGLLIY